MPLHQHAVKIKGASPPNNNTTSKYKVRISCILVFFEAILTLCMEALPSLCAMFSFHMFLISRRDRRFLVCVYLRKTQK